MLALKIKIIYSFQHLQRIWNEGQRKVAYFKLFYRIEYYSSSESGRKIWSKSEAFCLWTVAGFIFLNPDILGHSLTPSAQIAHYSNFCIERALSQAALVKLPWRNPICEKKKKQEICPQPQRLLYPTAIECMKDTLYVTSPWSSPDLEPCLSPDPPTLSI